MNTLWKRYPALLACQNEIEAAVALAVQTYQNGGKLLLCGNGGSAADCEHIAGELLKGFLSHRPVEDERIPQDLRNGLQGSLPAIPLPSLTAAMTATLNDLEPTMVYAQLLHGLGVAGDLLVAISTSGNSKSVCNAARLAHSKGLSVLALTGEGGGELAAIADLTVRVPARQTFRIQEYHLPVYHYLCAKIEDALFGNTPV